jgi:hypothetical protein
LSHLFSRTDSGCVYFSKTITGARNRDRLRPTGLVGRPFDIHLSTVLLSSLNLSEEGRQNFQPSPFPPITMSILMVLFSWSYRLLVSNTVVPDLSQAAEQVRICSAGCRKIDCVDYGAGLYSPPSQTQAVLNPSQVYSNGLKNSADVAPAKNAPRSSSNNMTTKWSASSVAIRVLETPSDRVLSLGLNSGFNNITVAVYRSR